jgi:polysaccharide biosynthesis protein PslG
MNSPAYSVQAFLWYRPETADRDLGLILAMGFSWVKQEFAWRDMEGARKGAFDWSKSDNVVYAANRKKVDILARLDNSPDWAAPGCFNAANSTMGPPTRTQDWLDFLRAFASRYNQRVRAYEIWNEPNLAREWCNKPPDPVAYAEFLKASYGTIKSVDPTAMIISGGLDPTTCCADGGQALPDTIFLQKLYDAMGGNSTGYFDVLGAHAAGYKADPEADPAVVANDPVLTNHDPSPPELRRIYCFRHVEDIRQIMVARGDTHKQIAITEFGWTSDPVNPAYAWFRVDEQTKADRIVRAYQYAKAHWSPWIGVMSLIYMASPDWTKTDEKYWWAITDPDGTPRAAYVRLKEMQK